MSGSSSDDDSSPQSRPRPSWGQPGPAEPTQPVADPAATPPRYGVSGPPPHPSPYGSTPATAPQGGVTQVGPYGQPQRPPVGDQQGWGQPAGHQGSGQQGWGQPGSGQPGWGLPPSPSQYGQDLRRHEQSYAQMYGEKPRTGMSVTSMVLGIVAILICWAPFGSYVAVVLGLLAVIFGIVGMRRAGRGMAIAGLVVGGIALVAAIFASVYWTRVGLELIDITQECADRTGRTSGPAFERCVTDGASDVADGASEADPFESLPT